MARRESAMFLAIALALLAMSCAMAEEDHQYYDFYTHHDQYIPQTPKQPKAPATPSPLSPPVEESDKSKSRVMVAIQGSVLCQNCSHGTSRSLASSSPLVGASVAVICKDDMDRTVYYQTEKTKGKGYFYHLILDNEGLIYDPVAYDPVDYCEVHLVSSPNPECSIFTNINNGFSGSTLRLEKSFTHNNIKVLLYSSPPLAFGTPLDKCPYPGRHH